MGYTSLYTGKRLGDFGTSDALVALSRATDINNVTLVRPVLKGHIKVCRESINWWLEQVRNQKEKQRY
jgi:hypothetical protein